MSIQDFVRLSGEVALLFILADNKNRSRPFLSLDVSLLSLLLPNAALLFNPDFS